MKRSGCTVHGAGGHQYRHDQRPVRCQCGKLAPGRVIAAFATIERSVSASVLAGATLERLKERPMPQWKPGDLVGLTGNGDFTRTQLETHAVGRVHTTRNGEAVFDVFRGLEPQLGGPEVTIASGYRELPAVRAAPNQGPPTFERLSAMSVQPLMTIMGPKPYALAADDFGTVLRVEIDADDVGMPLQYLFRVRRWSDDRHVWLQYSSGDHVRVDRSK